MISLLSSHASSNAMLLFPIAVGPSSTVTDIGLLSLDLMVRLAGSILQGVFLLDVTLSYAPKSQSTTTKSGELVCDTRQITQKNKKSIMPVVAVIGHWRKLWLLIETPERVYHRGPNCIIGNNRCT